MLAFASTVAWAQNSLTANESVRGRLTDGDYRALVAAGEAERTAAALLARYYENYDTAAALAAEYEKATDAATADSIWVRHDALTAVGEDIADSLGATWERIFDNKTFAYNYLLDVGNHRDVLLRMEQAGREAHDEFARRSEDVQQEGVLKYLTFKSLVFRYEKTLAELFGMTGAADSLRAAEETFVVLKGRALPSVELRERIFIIYEPIAVHSPARYNAANPIPEVEVHRRGTIFRVRLNTYTARQAVAVFKGLYPLGYVREGDRWTYYAGGYAEPEEAEKALADVKKRGFAKAVLVVWDDGEAVALTDGAFMVEIAAAGALSEAVRGVITATGMDLVRSAAGFSVGTFDSGLGAARVAAAIRRADPSLSVRTRAE